MKHIELTVRFSYLVDNKLTPKQINNLYINILKQGEAVNEKQLEKNLDAVQLMGGDMLPVEAELQEYETVNVEIMDS